MRVAQVSAHYPPNFVSGGTLVPQRIARAVAAAGHESHVFAGRLDVTDTPLSRSSEDDGHGVTVEWLVTTPWTGWSDERNYDNPDAVRAFESWLREVRPEVVHFHSIQTLGAGMLRAAKDSGARVILTMHDFWWFCARQFLVDREMRPCSLVVDCGTCSCEAGRAHLERRNSLLAVAVEDADVILAPSAAARDVLIANGAPAGRLRVDENGLPDEQVDLLSTSVADRAPGASARFMYAGGDQPMKGGHVLAEALRSLEGLNGIEIDLYGLGEREAAGLPAWAKRRDSFLPDVLGDVLAGHDVLVLPSVMRESHSIITREALAAGLAVICTDTLGPEEAVRHGYNGLVVPAGDSGSLAEAIRRVVVEPGLRESLSGRGSVSPIRRFSEQAEGLIALYRELVGEATTPSSSTTVDDDQPIRSVLFVVGIQGAPLRYRARLPAEALATRGITARVLHYRDPELLSAALYADAVVFYRVPATIQTMALIDSVRARLASVPVLFDVDDLIFDPTLEGQLDGLESLSAAEHELWWRGVARYRTTMEVCDVFVGSTAELCSHASATTGLPARRFANGVGFLLARCSDAALRRPRMRGPVRIGYFSGTTTHDADWASVEPAVVDVLTRHPEVELWLGGHLDTTRALEPFADRVVTLPFVAWYELPGILRDTDICLAPLTINGRFNEAKSAIKWLEAALVETPTVAAPTGPFREAIDHGRNGMLCSTTTEWVDALERLVVSEAERRRMGTQARRDALLTWSPHLQGAVYEQILRDAAALVRDEGPRRPTGWAPVADDEPYSAVSATLDPYTIPDVGGDPVGESPGRLRRTSVRVAEILNSEGISGLVRRALGRLRTLIAIASSRLRKRW